MSNYTEQDHEDALKLMREDMAGNGPREESSGDHHPTPDDRVERVYVFEPGCMARLADTIRQITNGIKSLEFQREEFSKMLKKAEAMAAMQPLRVTPRDTPPRTDHRPTHTAAGPRKILAALLTIHPVPASADHLSKLAGFAPGTVRTYLPVLREAALIEADAAGLYALTQEGKLSAESKP